MLRRLIVNYYDLTLSAFLSNYDPSAGKGHPDKECLEFILVFADKTE